MAKCRRRVYNLPCIPVLLLILLFCSIHGYNDIPTTDIIQRWAELLQSRLIPHLDKFSGIRNLEKNFDDFRKVKSVKLDGHKLVRKMSHDLTKYLEQKMAALERSVEAAEAAVKNYKYEPSITIGSVEFVKMKNFSDNDHRLVFSEKFKKGVNFSYSGVHIPVEIYEGYPEILNGLKWSASLDPVFRENLKIDPDLMWQYFGSQTGYMRTYPANKWIVLPRKPDFPDLYDVRLRPWYVHASSSPKDMLILMDSSGSMHGQTMGIMKIAVKTLLTTLGENDFVNVVKFSDEANWITCFDTFVQANRRNKQILSKGIDSLSDRNMASLSLGLEFAFKEFIRFRENKTEPWAGADCNQVIMLFSDGGTEEAWDVLEKYNSDKKIRVFTYAVGPHPVPYATLKEISCTNRGYFTTIPAMGAIRTKIQDYVKVLGRPLVLSTEKHFQWTNFYLDAMGLGMMTTVTLPVFNRTEGGNQSMVGVMGVDITTQQMLDFEPSFEIGPTGYSFGMNRNGYIVFHPDLDTEFEVMDDPPHADILEVEIRNPAKEELRKSMINLETGKKAIISFVKMPDDKHIVRYRMEYFYTPLNKTSFTLAVVLPTDRMHNLVVNGMNFSEGIGLEENMDGIFLAPWRIVVNPSSGIFEPHLGSRYCHFFGNPEFNVGSAFYTLKMANMNTTHPKAFLFMPTDDSNCRTSLKYCHNTVLNMDIHEVIRNLSITLKKNPEQCKVQLMQRLLWDVRKTEDIIHYWETEGRDNQRDGVIATFVQTEGGLTRVYPPSEAIQMRDQINPSRSLAYQRAFYGENYVFLPPKRPYELTANQTYEALTMIVKSVSFARSGINYKPAVVGVIVDPLWLQPFLLNTPSGPGRFPVSCSDVDTVVCYLIDDGGFIISSNQPNHMEVIGKFMGIADSELMTELYKKTIYERNEDFNYEDRCPKDKSSNAGFRTAQMPLYSILSSLNIGWLFDVAAWAQIKYWLLNFISTVFIPTTDALPEFFELPNETTCTTHKAQYYLAPWGRAANGEIHCKNCTRYYSIAKVGRTNIMLLVSSKPCSPIPCDAVPPLLQASEQDTRPDICDRPLRYRLRPDRCYSYSPEENSSECGSANALTLPRLALTIELCVLFAVKVGFMDQSERLPSHGIS